MTQYLPMASAVIIVVFAALVFRRYLQRGGAHLLLWGIGLSMFGVGSLTEAYSTVAWHPSVFRLWYLTGAILNAAWLGHGTVFLLSRRRRTARALLALLIVGSMIATWLIFTTPLNAARFNSQETLSAQYREILPLGAPVRRLTPIFNIYGLLTLVGGALYSAWLLWRKEIVPNRVLGNLLIAVGALALGFASVLVRLGLGDFLYVAEMIAAIFMFGGFLLATSRAGPSTTATAVPST
ncbi:MAG TPA: hypothetical protein VFH67_06585 [bacterium]|nr:hypothetical protein [bacterium]